MKKTLYLAGGITGLSYQEATAWRRHVAECLGDRYNILDPMRDKDMLAGSDNIGLEDDHPALDPYTIFNRDIADIDAADGLLVRLDTAKSVGTPWEMGYAYAKGKAVYTVAPIALFNHPFVRCPSTVIWSSLEQAINDLMAGLPEDLPCSS